MPISLNEWLDPTEAVTQSQYEEILAAKKEGRRQAIEMALPAPTGPPAIPRSPEQQTEIDAIIQQIDEDKRRKLAAERQLEYLWSLIRKPDEQRTAAEQAYIEDNLYKQNWSAIFSSPGVQNFLQNVGGMASTPIPGPAGIMKAAGVAGLGGAAGEALYQTGQALTGVPGAPETSGEAFNRMLRAGGTQAAIEIPSRYAMKRISPGMGLSAEEKQAIKYAESKGVHLTPRQRLASQGKYRWTENVAEASLWGGRSMQLAKIDAAKALTQVGKELPEKFGSLLPDEAAEELYSLLTNKFAAQRAVESQLHRGVLEAMGGDKLVSTKPIREMSEAALRSLKPLVQKKSTQISTNILESMAENLLSMPNTPVYQNLKAAAAAVMDYMPTEKTALTKVPDAILGDLFMELLRIPPQASTPVTFAAIDYLGKSAIPALSNSRLMRIFEQGASLPETGPFSSLKTLRSQLGDLIFDKEASKLFTTNQKRVAGQVYRSWMKAYEDPIYGLPNEAITLLTKANKFSTKFHEDFEQKIIQKIWKTGGQDMDALADWILRSKGPKGLDIIKETIGPEANDVVGRAWIRNIFADKAIDPTTSLISGRRLLTTLDNYPQLQKTIKPDQFQEIKNFAKALQMQQEAPARAGGGMWIQLTQASLAGSVFIYGGYTKDPKAIAPAVVILAGPKLLGYLFTNKYWTRALTNALMESPAARAGPDIFARLLKDKTVQQLGKMDAQKTGFGYPSYQAPVLGVSPEEFEQ